jgi:L-histidine N-alpha-methyltransferase
MSPQQSLAANVIEQDDDVNDEFSEIIDGLRLPQKSISPKYFYDEPGSRLFDQITRLPEYYLTRTELAIMKAFAGDMAAMIGPRASLIEFGSGSSLKILAAYVPVDISREHLVASADKIARDFPAIEVLPVAADFTQPFDLPRPRVLPVKNIVYFPGSTIGNFSSREALNLLRTMRRVAQDSGGLLIGIDLQKDRDLLTRAYNDRSGVTAEFNLNVLRRLNREFDADFDLDAWRHEAIYDDDYDRIEMYLVSRRDQDVRIGDDEICFSIGERILTEHSHKYTIDAFAAVLDQAGFRFEEAWTDRYDMFAVCYASAIESR